MKIKNISIVVLLTLISTFSIAQNPYRMTGEVIDAYTRKALADIAVYVESNEDSHMTQSDEAGQFEATLDRQSVRLTFSYPGYKSQSVYVNGRDFVSVTLVPEVSRSVLDSPDYSDRAATTAFSYEEVLSGSVAGADVTKRSGIASEGSLINIRGVRSLYGNNKPLVIVDGMPIVEPIYESAVDGYIENSLKDIDVKDIDKVTVLKNGSAIYGSRAAGGVIIIDTKRAKDVKTYIDFTAFGGVETSPNQIPMMNSNQYNSYLVEKLVSEGLSNEEIIGTYSWLGETTDPNLLNDTSWQDEVYKDVSTLQNYYLNVRGGDAMAKYSISLGFMDKENPMGNVGSQRYNTHLNGDMQVIEKLKMNAQLGYSVSTTDLLPFGTDANTNPVTATLVKAPIFSSYEQILDEQGGVSTMNSLSDTDIFGMTNPIALIENTAIKNQSNHLFGSVGFNYSVLEGLTASATAGVDYNKVRQDLFIPSLGVAKLDGIEYDRKAERNVQTFNSFYSDLKVEYNKEFTVDHLFSAIGGVNYQTSKLEIINGVDYAMPNDEFTGLGSGSSTAASSSLNMKRVYSNSQQWVTTSLYAAAKYDYAAMAGIDVALSVNGSSNYVAGSTTINPSVAAYFDLAESSLLGGAAWLDSFKLRAHLSSLGNDGMSNISSVGDYTSQMYRSATGVVYNNTQNSDLKPETTNLLNVGADISIFGQRMAITADYYNSKTSNMILWNENATINGDGGYWDNGATVSNSGIELGLSARLLQGRDFSWDIAANFAKNHSEVVELIGGESYINNIYAGKTITQIGGAPVEFYGLNEEGEYASLGSATPDFFGGFSTALTYKRFEFNVNFTFKSGNEAFNYTRMLTECGQIYGNQSVAMVNQTIDNDPSQSTLSYRWVEDASYIRLSKVHIAYTIPCKSSFIQSIKVFAEADNLATWTNYLGYNPDFSYSNSPYTAGVDYGKMPYGSSIVFGVKLGL
ncbi:MAG: SusC/RagA family TonB-linked outer membrane protein [Rikenellaceae bacterium]